MNFLYTIKIKEIKLYVKFSVFTTIVRMGGMNSNIEKESLLIFNKSDTFDVYKNQPSTSRTHALRAPYKPVGILYN